MKFHIYFCSFFIILCSHYQAQEMPSIKYNQAEIFHNASYDNDTLYIKIQNPLHCPIRVKFFSEYLKIEIQ